MTSKQDIFLTSFLFVLLAISAVDRMRLHGKIQELEKADTHLKAADDEVIATTDRSNTAISNAQALANESLDTVTRASAYIDEKERETAYLRRLLSGEPVTNEFNHRVYQLENPKMIIK